jgi:hypothetical protein
MAEGLELEQRIAALKALIAARPEREAVDARLATEVDSVLYLFYDDIGSIKQLALKSLFDLFLIKVLYVGRGGRDLSVLDYLSDMLLRFLWTRELVRFNNRYDFLYALLQEMNERQRFHNLFEACRHLADNALFVTGLFPTSQPWRRRRGMSPSIARFDRSHFIDLGRRYYRLAAEEELAEVIGQRPVLTKLAEHFTFYMEALNEVSERYILGFDMQIIADRMLDALNLYRRTGDEQHMENARKYAALLKMDRRPAARRRFYGVPILGAPAE